MSKEFPSHFEGQEGFVAPEKPEPEKGPSEQPKARDFLYDPQKQEILIFSKSKSGEVRETRHPFQEFLYALRKEEVQVSTSEWIDMQKALAEGEIQSIDDLYVVSRAVLVKDITNYPKFDTVFGRMFYGLEPPKPETEEIEEEQREEKEEAEEENLSQEIVEPGFTEEHHGGEDVHKAIEDSNVVERRYDQFDKDQILNYEQFGRVLSKLTAIIQEATEVPTGKLDAQATVKSIAEHAGIPKLVWRKETEQKPKVILMFDVGGSTDEFRPIMEKLFAAAKDYLDDVEVYYFHNAIYGEVWPQKDGNYGVHFIPLTDILKKDRDSRVIIVGDAWMAKYELYNDYTDENGRYFPSGIDSFKQLRRNFEHVVWINPIKEIEHDKWDNSGTIAEIKKVFNMHDMTLRGLENAVRELMEK